MQADLSHTNIVAEEDLLIFSAKVLAQDVSYEDYLSGTYGRHVEWIYGTVIAMSPVSLKHVHLVAFLRTLFQAYLESTSGGQVLGDPFVMRVAPDLPGRQPDIQVVLPDRLSSLQENQMAGPANLVVEVVSPQSVQRDRGEKFQEYERGGVLEYWILDPIRQEALFYVRGEDELFHSRTTETGLYSSVVLDKLQLPVEILWQDTLPQPRETVQMVEQMLAEAS